MSTQQRGAGIAVRHAGPGDKEALCGLLNAIIAMGGTTALEVPMTPVEWSDHFLSGPDCIVCFVALSSTAEPIGFQALSRNSDLPAGWADIGTYTRRQPRIPGAGTALFEWTKAFARDKRLLAINATIRADNDAGIPYYDAMGFKTYKVSTGVKLRSGTPVDRISKVYTCDAPC